MVPILGPLIAAGGAILGSLIGGVSNNKANAAANATNLQIARENNEAAKQLWREQREAQLNQYFRERAYNDPSNQIARYRAAGLNPAMMLGNVQSGSVTSQALSAPPAMQQATVRPNDYSYIGNAVHHAASAYQAYQQARKTSADAYASEIDNITKSQENLARLNGMLEDNKIKSTTRKSLQLSYDMQAKLFNTQVKIAESQSENAILQNERAKIENEMLAFDQSVQKERYTLYKHLTDAQIDAVRRGIEVAMMNAVTSRMQANTAATSVAQQGQQILAAIDNMKKQGRLIDANTNGIVLDNKGKAIRLPYEKLMRLAELKLMQQKGKLTESQVIAEYAKIMEMSSKSVSQIIDAIIPF